MSNPESAELFEWDDDEEESGNVAHLGAHGIRPVDVEEVFANGGCFVKNKRSGSGDWKMIGPTDGGALLTIVLMYDHSRRAIRAFTGWRTTQDERKHWDD